MKVKQVGEFIRTQRQGAKMSLRKLAKAAGVSNPYLSQVERGLRRPSAEILQAIAKALRVSSQTLYVKAGILEEAPHPEMQADPSPHPAPLRPPVANRSTTRSTRTNRKEVG